MAGEKKGFFSRLKEGLSKTRDNIVAGIDAVFYGASEIDDDFYEELEEILIMGDIGVNATNDIIERMKDEVKKRHLRHPSECKELLVESIKEQMCVGETAYDFEKKQSIVFIIGVNGVGKTTSVGKLASILKGQGRKVLIAAADTFRAAAGEQLAQWAHRAGVDMIGGADGADPASVIFDAVNAAKARKVDVLICDTAGRLHNKKNLMEELRKMNRIIDREFPDAHRENLIVLDGTTGQNALSQAREFGEVADLTGVILTKMDGTAKGGIAVAIQSELNVPVKYIGVGETIEDLQKFNADEFVNALFDVKTEEHTESGPAQQGADETETGACGGRQSDIRANAVPGADSDTVDVQKKDSDVRNNQESSEQVFSEQEVSEQERSDQGDSEQEISDSGTFAGESSEDKVTRKETLCGGSASEGTLKNQDMDSGNRNTDETNADNQYREVSDAASQNEEISNEEDAEASSEDNTEKPRKKKWFFW